MLVRPQLLRGSAPSCADKSFHEGLKGAKQCLRSIWDFAINDEQGWHFMIGLVLVTHGRLADEFIHALEHVVGKQEKIEAICIGPDDRMDVRRADIAAAVERVNDGNGVMVLTDMFGGTPSNLAISLLEDGKVEVVAG